MANKSFVIQYLIKSRDQFSAAANKASKATKKMAKELVNANKKMAKFEKQTKKMARATKKASFDVSSNFKNMAASVIGFVGVSKFLSESSAFQDAIADLAAITGSSGRDLKTLTDESLRLAKVSSIAQSEVAGAFKIVASAKSELLKDPRALSQVTEQILLLKNATGIELADAARVVTESLNQFNASADQAARFVNVLAAGSKVGASEVAETGIAIFKAGVAAKLAGLSFEQTNAAIQVLAKNGLKAEVAGTGLQSVLLRLETQTNKMIKPSIVGLSVALENLSKANLTTTQQSKLFGVEHIKVGNILVSNSKLLNKWTDAVTGSDEAQLQATARLSTFSAKMRKISIVVNDALIKAFLRLEPEMSKMAVSFAEFVGSVDDSNIRAFAESAKILLNVLKGLGFVGKEFLGIFKGVGSIIGETMAALVTGDFGQFDLGQAFRIGGDSSKESGVRDLSKQSVDVNVGVNVGVADGLEQKSAAKVVKSAGARRSDVGHTTAGAR